MERLNGWKRLWVVIGVLAGLYVMFHLSDEFLSPAKHVKALFDAESVRLDATLKQVSTGVGSEEAVKQAEEAITASKVSYVEVMQNLPKVAIFTFILSAIVAILAGVATFLAGFAMEWVYRGFRPLPIAPTVEGQSPPAEPSEPISAQEQLPALPNPDSQRKT